jgi:hypothetical protein
MIRLKLKINAAKFIKPRIVYSSTKEAPGSEQNTKGEDPSLVYEGSGGKQTVKVLPAHTQFSRCLSLIAGRLAQGIMRLCSA